MICQGCGKTIDVTRSKWCSKRCQNAQRKRPPRNSGRYCVVCRLELRGNQLRYCGERCKNSHNNVNRREDAMTCRFCPCGAYLPMSTPLTVNYCPTCNPKNVYGDEGGNGVDIERFRRIAR